MSNQINHSLNVDSTNQTARTEQSTMGDANIKQVNVDSPLPGASQKVDQNKGLEKRDQIKQESSVKAAETPTTNALGRIFSAFNGEKLKVPNSSTPDTERVSMAGDFRGLSINAANQKSERSSVFRKGHPPSFQSPKGPSLEERSSGNKKALE